MARILLQIHEIEKAQRLERSFPLDDEWVREALADTDLSGPAEGEDSPKGTLDVVARKVMDDILVEGEFRAALQAPCSRCNVPVSLALDGQFTQLFSNRTTAELPEELELTPEDLDRETYSGEEIALDGFVREFILLEVPMSPRCEGGCADPEVRRILRLGPDGEPLPRESSGPLAALGALAEQLRKQGGEEGPN